MTGTSVTIPDRNGHRERLSFRSEPLTYSLNGPHSFFGDLLAAHQNKQPAVERLRRHEKEMRAEMPHVERRGSSTAPDGTTYEYRAPAGGLGTGGYGTPPLWSVELEGVYQRPERVVADLANRIPLPAGVGSVNVPILSTPMSAQQQIPTSPVAGASITDSAASSPVITVAGNVDLPLQLVEQSPKGVFEQVLIRDLQASYDANLEALLINGTGGTAPLGTILGLTNVAGINSLTYTSGSPTATGLFPTFGQAFGIVSNNRKIRPQGWLMRGGRFGWLASSEDQQSRPLDVPLTAQSIIDDPTKPDPVGSLLGLPIWTDEQLPSTQGTGQNQDVIIGFRYSDLLLWESDAVTSVYTQAINGALMARVHFRRYAAAILGRYPSGVVTIGGTGLVVQTNE